MFRGTTDIATRELLANMSDLNRGTMKFENADRPLTVAVSAVIILGSIGALVLWALRVAYAF